MVMLDLIMGGSMKKTFVILCMLALFACDTGIELNVDCVLKHTAEHVSFASTLDTMELSIVNLTWTWGIFGMPSGDGVIIERMIDAGFDSIGYVTPIETLMTFFDTTEALSPGMDVTYKLLLRSGMAIDSICTTDFTIPEAQHFYYPDTEFIQITDSLRVEFSDLAMFEDTDIELYRTSFTELDSLLAQPLTDILTGLNDTVFSTTLTDTIAFIPESAIDSGAVYIIKISSSAMSGLDYITDTSIGLRTFIRLP